MQNNQFKGSPAKRYRRVTCRQVSSLLAVLVVPFLSGCDEASTPKAQKILLHEYEAFTDSVSSLHYIPVEEMPAVVERWRQLEDKIFELLSRDSLYLDDESYAAVNSMSLYGSIIFNRLFESIDQQCVSFPQLASVQWEMAKTQFPDSNTTLEEAYSFYQKALRDTLEFNLPEDQYSAYLDFLTEAEKKNVSSWEELRDLLYEEDLLYRSYIKDVFAHTSSQHAVITEMTEAMMCRFSDYAGCHQEEGNTLFAYLSVRTTQRQLLCAERGLCAVIGKEIDSSAEAEMAVTSFIAPFVNFNPLLITQRTQGQNENLQRVGELIPTAFSALESQGLLSISAPDSLPGAILKDYISYIYSH